MTTAIPTSPTSPAELQERLPWRYATMRFDPAGKVDPTTWSALEESLRLAPSSFGLQPCHFVVVTAPATKARLRPTSNDQLQITDCSPCRATSTRS